MKNNIVIALDEKGQELVRFTVEFGTPEEAYEYVLRLQKLQKKAKRSKKRDLQDEFYLQICKIRRFYKREKLAYVDLVLA